MVLFSPETGRILSALYLVVKHDSDRGYDVLVLGEVLWYPQYTYSLQGKVDRDIYSYFFGDINVLMQY